MTSGLVGIGSEQHLYSLTQNYDISLSLLLASAYKAYRFSFVSQIEDSLLLCLMRHTIAEVARLRKRKMKKALLSLLENILLTKRLLVEIQSGNEALYSLSPRSIKNLFVGG